MSQTISRHAHAHAPQTVGRVIHWATSYDLLISLLSFGRMRRIYSRIADLVQAKPGDALLDVGCGPGNLALLLAQRVESGGMVAGIDASPEMIARARQKARRRGVPVDFRLEPVEALSFADQSFDGVVSSFVYHHLPDDLKPKALASMARVLKPGGRVCMVDFMPRPDSRRGRASDQRERECGNPETASARPRRGAHMATDMHALAEQLRENGFTDIISGYQLPSLGLLARVLGLPPAGYVLARKPDSLS